MARIARYFAGYVALIVLASLAVACSPNTASRRAVTSTSSPPGSANSVPGQGVGRTIAFPLGSRFQAGVPLTSVLFVDADSQAAVWARANPTDPRAQVILQRIANQPTGIWLGAWSGDIRVAVSTLSTKGAAADRIPILVAYNIPGRDCGGQSAGGQADEAAYDAWINGFAAGLGGRRAIIILEPDALAMDNCLDASAQAARLRMLAYAVTTLRHAGGWVYIDAGHANWVPADQMAQRLRDADVADANGFALNVSNYDPVALETTYGADLNGHLAAPKPFIIDSSRDGAGVTDGEWCNPAGRQLGPLPQTGQQGAILLWIKAPGESDGQCGIGTGIPAGQFSPTLAERLLTGA